MADALSKVREIIGKAPSGRWHIEAGFIVATEEHKTVAVQPFYPDVSEAIVSAISIARVVADPGSVDALAIRIAEVTAEMRTETWEEFGHRAALAVLTAIAEMAQENAGGVAAGE